MKEQQIRKKALEIILKQGGVVWFPYRVKYKVEQDIFGVFDLIVIFPPSNIVFVQLTTKSNIRAREKKIMSFMKGRKVSLYCECWGWDNVNNNFKILHIYGNKIKKKD